MNPMRQPILAELITISNDIWHGHTPDTQATWLCNAFDHIGVQVIQATTIREEQVAISQALSMAQSRAPIILIHFSTATAQANTIKQAQAKDGYHSWATIQERLQANGFLSNLSHEQIKPLNMVPGLWWEQAGKIGIAIPSISQDMQAQWQDTLLALLKEKFDLPAVYHQTIHTIGIDQASLVNQLNPWLETMPSYMQLTYLAGLGTISLKLTARGNNSSFLEKALTQATKNIQSLIEPDIYGYQETTLEEAVGNLLKSQNKRIAIAESCSGGYVSHLITRVAGSSTYYQGGMVAYHDSAKIDLLGVQATTLNQYAAVSQETAVEMAQQVRTKFRADIGLSATGFAGPTGGTEDNPVGTIWIALADGQAIYAEKLSLQGNRLENIQHTALSLLNLLRKVLQGCYN